MRYTARQRLRRDADFEQIRASGLRTDCGAFTMQWLARLQKAGEKPLRRFAVIASRKTGDAVRRNRAKRVFREIFRLNQEALPNQCDIIIVVRPNFQNYSFAELQQRYLKAVSKINFKLNR